jgi:TolB-like protein
MGDGLLISFNLASDAVSCAIDIQKACKKQEIPLKIGIHEGEMVYAGSDVLGDGVNIASRLQEGADEGCIFISSVVYNDIKNRSAYKTEFVGEKSLKGLPEPVKVYNVFSEGNTEASNQTGISDHKIPDKKSIIVLPFENISSDPEQEYFSDGLTEEIITDLSFIHDLTVISRSSAMTFKGTRKKIKDIAREVNVHYVLEGSVRKAGNKLRITAQLIDGTNDTHIWAEKYSGNLDDIFDIQEKVSKSIIDELKLKLSKEEKNKISEHLIHDAQAYECYMRAMQYIWNFTEESLQKSLEYLNHGLGIIGDSVLIYSGMSYVYLQLYHSGLRPEVKYLDLAEEYINKIFDLEPGSAHGHGLYGLLIFIRLGSTKESYDHLKKSYSLVSNNPTTMQWLLYITAMHKGNKSAAEPLINNLLRIDPLSPVNIAWGSIIHYIDGRFNLMVDAYYRYCRIEPDNVNAHWALMYAYFRDNQLDKAYEVVHEIKSKWPDHIFTRLSLLLNYSINRDSDSFNNILTNELEDFAWTDFILPLYMAECYALLDQRQKSIKWLEQAINRGMINYPFFNTHDAFLNNIRGEKRFIELMKRVKIEWENFEA